MRNDKRELEGRGKSPYNVGVIVELSVLESCQTLCSANLYEESFKIKITMTRQYIYI